jgi:tetratricopeptide (TPR) repeat protein
MEGRISTRARAAAVGLVAAAAMLAVTRAAAPQTALATEDAAIGVAEQIETIQAAHGINSAELVAPLTNLGLIFREQGDVDLAIAAFERARHLVRVNHGFSSFKEAPLLRQLVQIEEARGNASVAWNLEQELLGLIRRNPGPAAAPMLREIADKRVDVLERYVGGELPPQIELGCYYSGPARRDPGAIEAVHRSCRSGSSWAVKQALYEEARVYYVDTIEMIQRSEGAAADDVPELYRSWVRAMYAARNDYGTEHEGAGTLRVIHSKLVEYSKPLPAQMSALVDIADWGLLFAGGRKENEAALQAYERLYDQFRQEGIEQPFIDGIFSPSLPVVLPAFSPNPLVATQTPGSRGFVDVAFEITKYGQGESIEFLDTSTNATEDTRTRVGDLIKRIRFRPRVAGGVFENPSRVVVRYYVND